jgi:uncharacterized coiled-coil DUF342 family protein
MSWSPLLIRGISFNGSSKEAASLKFRSGLNVVRGVSDTGKSFAVKAIDFLFGATSPLKDIPERSGYDRVRLILRVNGEKSVTIERSVEGGHFNCFDEVRFSGNFNSEGITLGAKHTLGKENTLSYFLLSSIGLENQLIRKNAKGETNSLSFRNLVNLVVVDEEAIIKESSPFLTGQYTSSTSEYSVIKRLLTGVDDSALITIKEEKARQANAELSNKAKIELIDELIQELQAELTAGGINRRQAEQQIAQLTNQEQGQQEALANIQSQLDSYLEQRRGVMEEIRELDSRIGEISGLLSRFSLLQDHYRVDLDRLAAIQESGSLFVYFEQIACPLCGTPPDEQHSDEACDGNIERVVNGAAAEIDKIRKLSVELGETSSELEQEQLQLNLQKEEITPRLEEWNQRIQMINSPFQDARNSFFEISRAMSERRKAIEMFERIDAFREKRNELFTLSERSEETEPSNIRTDLSKKILDEFSQVVSHLLREWNFPDVERVYFDEQARDIVLNGKPRSSQGKGKRAITHAAMNIGLMEFCKSRDLAHPGFVILDSPLLSYYGPEDSSDSLAGTDVKERFYNYLADNYLDSQIIIFENEYPPSELEEKINLVNFTRNPQEGRYGFFPVY